MNFIEYQGLLQQLHEIKSVTGADKSEEMVQYSELNFARFNRLLKTTEINEDIKQEISKSHLEIHFLVLTESWCGDAAQIIPVFEKMIAHNPRWSSEYRLRDENEELMNQYLTNGGKSIPVFVPFRSDGTQMHNKWGPRPENLQTTIDEWKKEGITKEEWIVRVQKWYTADKTQSIQQSLHKWFQDFAY